MGWLHPWGATRKSIIERVTQSQDSDGYSKETIKHCAYGNVLWTVEHIKNEKTGFDQNIIGCYLIRPGKEGWGYKDMCEEVHPYYYTCPLSYLELAPEMCPEWRNGVRAYWEKRKVKRGTKSL